MDGQYDSDATASHNIAGLIRSANGGMCSGEPAGIRYPGVPSVEEVLAQLGIDDDGPMSEVQWYDACVLVMEEEK